MSDARLRRLLVAHLVTIVGEWAAVIATLIHAYDWGGPRSVGFVSLAVLAPAFVGAPLAAAATARVRAHDVRLAGFAIQGAAYSGAALVAGSGAPTPAVAALVAVGIAASATLHPTGAALLPKVVRSARGLVTGNLVVSYCDSAAALVGPLLAAVIVARAGPGGVFATVAAGAALAFLATAWRPAALAVSGPRRFAIGDRGGLDESSDAPGFTLRTALAEVRSHPWSLGVLGVASARNLVVGAFDVLLVIVARSSLELGEGGPGYLTALFGGGAIVGAFATTAVVRRSRLRSALIAVLLSAATLCLALGARAETPLVVIAVLPIVGLCVASMDSMSRVLLQRSIDPRRLGPVFAGLGLIAACGQVSGALLAQALVAWRNERSALVGVGVLLALIAAAAFRSLRQADTHADVPIVEMALISGLPIFASLPTPGLESVARAAESITVPADTEVIRQGDSGDTFFVVADGEFDVIMSGVHERTARRGDFFGEVALLADVDRTASVIARTSGSLLAIQRVPFLTALTGHRPAYRVATAHIRGLHLDIEGDLRWRTTEQSLGSTE